jgi:hypothetical protein
VNEIAVSVPVQSVIPPTGTVIGGPPPTHIAGGGPSVGVGTHDPPEHPVPAAQTRPHMPQLLLSSLVFVQLRLQAVRGGVHDVAQPFERHTDVPGHTLPQLPQLFGSTAVVTHTPPHNVCPYGHVHAPIEQNCPLGHTCPHVPQLLLSLCRLRQVPLQLVVPDAQQIPDVQLAPDAHEVPHVPQLRGSVCVFVHIPLQSAGADDGHVHDPATQLSPPMQTVPHVPQLLGSLDGSMQSAPHVNRGEGHDNTQVPALQ